MRSRQFTLSFFAFFFVLGASLFAQPRFSVTIPQNLHTAAFDGRLLLMLSTDSTAEPRFQVGAGLNTQLLFGTDVEGWTKGQARIVDESAFGFPLRSLSDVPAGRYRVQVLLHKYETFHRSDGHTVKLPMDRGEGQQWNRAPGNLFSTPQWISFDPKSNLLMSLVMDKEIPPISLAPETKYIKHVRIQSKLLSDFWGRPMYLGAHVLLPEGWAEHPNAHYPLMVFHGHFPWTFGGFREEPPAGFE